MITAPALDAKRAASAFVAEAAQRARVLEIAATWLGTPFHDCAKIKGVGTDCGCMIAAIFEEAGLIPVLDIKPYSPQFFLHREEPVMLGMFLDYTRRIDGPVKTGDIVLYRFGRQFSHAALVIPPAWPMILHAYKQAGMVIMGEGNGGDLEGRERMFLRFKGWM